MPSSGVSIAVVVMILRHCVRGFSTVTYSGGFKPHYHHGKTLENLPLLHRTRYPGIRRTTVPSCVCSVVSSLAGRGSIPQTNIRYQISSTRLCSTSSDVSQYTSIILEGLNPSQVEAVTQPLQTVTRVIAGPGSGKTRVLTCRVAYLLEQDRRSNVLAVTFTKKAAEEMRQRVESLLRQKQQQGTPSDNRRPKTVQQDGFVSNEDLAPAMPRDLSRVTLGTFHSICAKILRFNGDLLENLPSVQEDLKGSSGTLPVNLDGSFAILDASDQLRVLKECLDDAEIDLKNSAVKPLQVLNNIGIIKEAKAQGKDPFAEYYQNGKLTKPLPKPLKYAKEVYGLYREKLLTGNALDFDDLIFLTREVLIHYPNLQERLHQRWPHVLVDEFQDTSITQLDLVKLLTSRSLLVVGDADQSIYSWRGAHAGSLNDFRTEFQQFAVDGVHTVYLKENYRSTSNIVNAAEKVISSSSGEESKDEARRAMKPKRGSGPPPRVVACADERAEARFVVDTITEMVADSSLGPDSTVAVIYRTNAQSRYLEEACVQSNLPYVIRGGAGGFYKRAEVKDCLCYLRWLYNGNDESAMLRAFKTPSRGIGDKALAEFKDYCLLVDNYCSKTFPGEPRPSRLDVLISLGNGEGSIGTKLPEGAPEASEHISKRALKNFLPFAAQMNAIREKAYTFPVDSLLFTVIETFELLSHFDSISKSKSEFAERRENVQELRQATKRYSDYGPALVKQHSGGKDAEFFGDDSPLGNFLDDVSLVSDVVTDDSVSGNDSRLVVNLMTIHASKGTEFDAVFVVGNEEGTLPSHLSIQEGEGSIALEEEKRLCYVAMTRAKTRLILTWRKQVTSFSNWSDDGPSTSTKARSRFLEALVVKKDGKIPEKGTTSHKSKQIDANRGLQQTKNYSTARSSPPRRPNAPDGTRQNRLMENQMQRPSNPAPRLRNDASSRGQPSITGRMDSTRSRRADLRTSPPSMATEYSSSSGPAKRERSKQESAPTDRNPVARAPPETKPVDSTLFYPVGSDVTHNNFGKGVVLQPPPDDGSKKLMVRVKFENGRTMDFPADGYDLLPVF